MKVGLLTASFALALLASSPLQAATVDAAWTSATDVPVTAPSYTATGNSINLTLNSALPTGTNLTVVKNTGLAFITGTFSNLAQGQAVALSFGRVTYQFVANYYGGSGNDLVLQWASVRPMAWGRNFYGQLGNNSAADGNVPMAVLQSGVLFGKTAIAVAAGSAHSLVLCSDGSMAAWGYNVHGTLGDNSTTQVACPSLCSGAR